MTRLTTIALAALLCGVATGDTIAWHEGLAAAQQAASGSGRPVMVDFFGPGCGPCEELETITLAAPAVVARATRFECVRINAAREPEAATRYLVSYYPTVAFLDADGTLVHEREGFVAPTQFLDVMQTALTAHEALVSARLMVAEVGEKAAPPQAIDIARDFAAARQHAQAARWAGLALEGDAEDRTRASALLTRGQALLEAGEAERAVEPLLSYLTEYPHAQEMWRARLRLGAAWLQSGEDGRGIELLRVVAAAGEVSDRLRGEARRLLR